jgi:YD repeat-containing protein
VSSYSYDAYDLMGRVKSSSQYTDGVTYSMPDYQYDLVGNLTAQTYPSGKIVTSNYDAAGRLVAVMGQKAGEQDKTFDGFRNTRRRSTSVSVHT